MSIVAWLIGTKIGRSLLLAAGALIAFGAWSAWAYHKGVVHEQEKQAAAARAEVDRVRGVLASAQKAAQRAVQRQHELEMNNAKLVAAARAARPRDGDGCFDVDDSRLLNAIRKPGPQGAGRTARSAAR